MEEFLGIVDIVWQYVQVVTELGMTIELAGLLAQKGLMLAPAARGDNSRASCKSFMLTRMLILTDQGSSYITSFMLHELFTIARFRRVVEPLA